MEEHGAHRVVALALPAVVALNLSIAAPIFGHRDERSRYAFSVCSSAVGPLPTSTGFDVDVACGLDALGNADTVVVPGFHPLDAPDDASLVALHGAATRGAGIASVRVGAFALAEAGLLDGRAATTATHRTGGQTQYSARPMPVDGGLGPTREWAIAEMARPLTVRHLARHAGLPSTSRATWARPRLLIVGSTVSTVADPRAGRTRAFPGRIAPYRRWDTGPPSMP